MCSFLFEILSVAPKPSPCNSWMLSQTLLQRHCNDLFIKTKHTSKLNMLTGGWQCLACSILTSLFQKDETKFANWQILSNHLYLAEKSNQCWKKGRLTPVIYRRVNNVNGSHWVYEYLYHIICNICIKRWYLAKWYPNWVDEIVLIKNISLQNKPKRSIVI